MSRKVKLIVQLIGLAIAAYGVFTLTSTQTSGDPVTYFTIAIGFIIILIAKFVKTK